MEQLINKITNFANKLDSVLLIDEANAVDNIALSLIKTAQYVGSQGYWIRNKRCWSNCYRQKRGSFPNKPAQEIWFDCQSEYEDSINNEGNSWDKYAENNTGKNISLDIKIAEKLRDSSDIENELNNYLIEAEAIHKNAYLNATEKLLNIAESLDQTNKSLSLEAASIVDALLKEANWWDKMTGWKDVAKQWWNKQQNPSDPSRANYTYRDFVNDRESRRQQAKELMKNKGFRVDENGKPIPLNSSPQQQSANPSPAPTNNLNKTTPPPAKNQGTVVNTKTPQVQTQPQPTQKSNTSTVGMDIEKIINNMDAGSRQKAIDYINKQVVPYLSNINNSVYEDLYGFLENKSQPDPRVSSSDLKNKQEVKGIIENKPNIASTGIKVLFKI